MLKETSIKHKKESKKLQPFIIHKELNFDPGTKQWLCK